MRKFIRDLNIRDFAFPEEYREQFQDIVSKLDQRTGCKSSTLVLDHELCLDILQLSHDKIDLENKLWYSLAGYSLGSPHVIKQLDSDELLYIYEVYKIFFPGILLSHILTLFDKYAAAELASECFGSRFSRLNRYSYVLTQWACRFDGLVDLELAGERPGIIQYFVRQSIHFALHLFVGSSITQSVFTVVLKVLYQRSDVLPFSKVLARLHLSPFNVYLESLLPVMIKLGKKMYCLSCLLREKIWHSVVMANVGRAIRVKKLHSMRRKLEIESVYYRSYYLYI